MKKYLLTFVGGNPVLKYSSLDTATEEARSQHLKAWGEWMSGLAKSGKLEGGYPLENTGAHVSAGRVDGHDFSKGGPGGFIILKADSLDEATVIASSSPIIKNGGEVYVQPCGEVRS